ncbi:class I SAM-dependent methyltransferase [Pontibacter sp. JH31]|uniref:Class I SAM-dependent methyltransferase n=1 Tax=Pontibacter aquaedesilientis TaxID=2766980 RepID=A0ABR7XDG2_9BACT|nr:class I SAM-dependent methyltransferase [Pontibacter aquaedesilientis]MBD1396338.1 class I SAM-dependent methyltransferase [Pontibacter aquaedesilientis]
MDVRNAYNAWAEQYDTNKNRTRDLEGIALRKVLAGVAFDSCLEIGCGTGKNTMWLLDKARYVAAVDLSEGMLAKAKAKVNNNRVDFIQADITRDWQFTDTRFDLVTFSLVLEHISDLGHVFAQAANVLRPGGYVYVGELHPFKQYAGTKARFDTSEGRQEVPCYTHHVSDFVQAANQSGFSLQGIEEFFDEADRTTLLRILSLLLQKN